MASNVQKKRPRERTRFFSAKLARTYPKPRSVAMQSDGDGFDDYDDIFQKLESAMCDKDELDDGSSKTRDGRFISDTLPNERSGGDSNTTHRHGIVKSYFKMDMPYYSVLKHFELPETIISDIRYFSFPIIPAGDIVCLIKKQKTYGSSIVDMDWTTFTNSLFVKMYEYQTFVLSCYNRFDLSSPKNVESLLSQFNKGVCSCVGTKYCETTRIEDIMKNEIALDLSKRDVEPAFKCPMFFGRILVVLNILYNALNNYAYWFRLKKNAVKTVHLDGYANVRTKVSIKESSCVTISVIYKTIATIHHFLKPVQLLCMRDVFREDPELVANISTIYGSTFTSKADTILKNAISARGDCFFDHLKMSDIMHVVRSCYTYGPMVDITIVWRTFLECLRLKMVHTLFDAFENVNDVPHLRYCISDADFKSELAHFEKELFPENDVEQPDEISDSDGDVLVETMDVCDTVVAYVDESIDDEHHLEPNILQKIERKGRAPSLVGFKKTITDTDVFMEDDTTVKTDESVEKIKSFGIDETTSMTIDVDNNDDQNQPVDVTCSMVSNCLPMDEPSVDDDDDGGENDVVWMANDLAHLYYGFFTSYSFGFFGNLYDIPKKRLFDLSVFGYYDTNAMIRKQNIHHSLSLFLKLWSGFKLLNPSDMLRTELRNKYVTLHVSRDDVNWFLCEGEALNIHRRLTTDPERMLDKMYANMAKQIKDAGSKQPMSILKDVKNDSAYRGFLDWLRLYAATSCISVDVDKFFTNKCPRSLHYEQWLSAKSSDGANWFEQSNFPFIYMHNGRYNVFYNGHHIYRHDCPVALIQTINYLTCESFEERRVVVDFNIDIDNHKYVASMRDFWNRIKKSIFDKKLDDFCDIDESRVTIMMRALYVVANASKSHDVHCYDSGDYLNMFERIISHYYVIYHVPEQIRCSSEFGELLFSCGMNLNPTTTSKNDSNGDRRDDDVATQRFDVNGDFLNELLSRNFGLKYASDACDEETIREKETKLAFYDNMSRIFKKYLHPNHMPKEQDFANTVNDLFDGHAGVLKKTSSVGDTCYDALATWIVICLEYNDDPDLKKRIKNGLTTSLENLLRWFYEKSVYTNEDVVERMRKGDVEDSVLKEDKRKAAAMANQRIEVEMDANASFYANIYADAFDEPFSKNSRESDVVKRHTTAAANADSKNDSMIEGGTLYEKDFESFSRHDIGVYMKTDDQLAFLDDLKRCVEPLKSLRSWIIDYNYLSK